MQTKARKSIHDAETCKVVSNLRKLLRDANRGAEIRMRLSWLLQDDLANLRAAADEYMAAVVCYNENPWDRVNVRKYAAAKDKLSAILHPQPNTQIQRAP